MHEPAVDHPGWFTWNLEDSNCSNVQAKGSLLTRVVDMIAALNGTIRKPTKR